MSELQKNESDHQNSSWRNVVDRVMSFITFPKPTIRILNENPNNIEEKQVDAAKQNTVEALRRKIVSDFVNGDTSGDNRLTEIHVNDSFAEKSDSKVRCSTVYDEEQFQKSKDFQNRRQTSVNFLDEQYNLTKQAIARRYRPHMRINSLSRKNNTMREYLNEPFNQELYKISNVASEKIPMEHFRAISPMKTDNSVNPMERLLLNEDTFIIYEKKLRV